MTIEEFNICSSGDARDLLLRTCYAPIWANTLCTKRPFRSLDEILELANYIWQMAVRSDVLSAFDAHPKIGDKKSLKKKYQQTAQWASNEQQQVDAAPEQVIEELAQWNKEYEAKFGFIFIVCATGKSAEEMLQLLKNRFSNQSDQEFLIAKEEQRKIMNLRIKKLFL